MRKGMIFRTTLILLAGAAALSAGDPWKEKPYTQWSDKEVQRVVTDSPWAKEFGVQPVGGSGDISATRPMGTGGGVGGGGSPSGMSGGGSEGRGPNVGPRSAADDSAGGGVGGGYYIVRWLSSKTLRQGLVRQQKLNDEQAAQLLNFPPQHYIVAIVGPNMRAFVRLEDKQLMESSYLKPKKSKARIHPERVNFRRQGQNVTSVEFYFPKQFDGQPVFAADEAKVEFACELKSGIITVDFDLRRMVIEGQPDL